MPPPRSMHYPKAREVLEAQRRQLVSDIETDENTSRNDQVEQLNSEVHDRGEESNAVAQADVNAALLFHHRDELAEVEAALERINNGTYGICAKCREPMEPERLAAYPAAIRCIACQAEVDG